MSTYHEKVVLMDELSALLPKTFINHEPMSILGGFARRMYMIQNGIPMTTEDKEALDSADIDIFVPITNVIGKQSYDLLLKCSEATTSEDHLATLIDDTARSVSCYVSSFVDKILKEVKNGGGIRPSAPFQKVYRKRNYPLLLAELAKEDNIHSHMLEELHMHISAMTTLNGKGVSNRYMMSFKNRSMMIALTPHIQLIFKDETVSEMLEDFDFEQSKFEIPHPFCVGNIEKHGEFDNIYDITSINIKEGNTPFKMLDRMAKYNTYGFKFNNHVKEKFNQYVNTFIDEHDVTELPSTKSFLY